MPRTDSSGARPIQSGETSDFKPNGQSLLATKQKVSMLPRGFMSFPHPFPSSTDEFVALGLNTRPVFFGCEGAHSAKDQYPYVAYSPPYFEFHGPVSID